MWTHISDFGSIRVWQFCCFRMDSAHAVKWTVYFFSKIYFHRGENVKLVSSWHMRTDLDMWTVSRSKLSSKNQSMRRRVQILGKNSAVIGMPSNQNMKWIPEVIKYFQMLGVIYHSWTKSSFMQLFLDSSFSL